MSTLTKKNRHSDDTSAFHSAVWAGLNTAGNATTDHYSPQTSLAVASVQVTGTFGGATVTILGSNDGVNFAAIKDATGAALSFTAAGVAELSSGFAHYKPNVAGGVADTLGVALVHWTR